jgi:hypothetical protein
MSAEQYFDKPDTASELQHCLPYGWRAEVLSDNVGIEFQFPVPNTVSPVLYLKAGMGVNTTPDVERALFDVGCDDAIEGAETGQMHYTIETRFPLPTGLFAVLEDTKQRLAVVAAEALKPDEQEMNHGLTELRADKPDDQAGPAR